MKWFILLMLIGTLGCTREVQTICGTLRCPNDQKTVSISTVDALGKPMKAAYIETFNFRTGVRRTDLQGWPYVINPVAFKYELFRRPSEFSSSGDAVSIKIRSETGSESLTYHKIAGGECSCDVIRISGLAVIQID
jgi:hypothetical protein